MSNILQIRNKGSLTLPADLRRKYNLVKGAVFTLIDLGDGSFVLTPRLSQVDYLGDRVSQMMVKECVTVDEMLSVLDEERERYYQERYVKA